MSNTRFMLRGASYLILIKSSKILLLRRFNTGWEDGKYTLISGHLNGNETVKEAMIREAKEEAGIIIKSRDLHVAHTTHRKSRNRLEYIDFFLRCDRWQGKPRMIEGDKCDDMQWFPLDHLPKNTLPYIKQAIESYFKNISFSEVGFG